jgi:hypothetical protein
MAAVSSIASGRPSTRRQISPINPTARSVSSEGCIRPPARSRNKRTAGHASISARPASVAATASGDSRWFSSSTTHSGSRLVASTCRPGSRAINSSTSWATADTTCSQLSSTSSRSRSASHRVSASTWDSPPERCSPTCVATSPATRSADRSDASQTTKTPSGNLADDSAATASANAVLPTPPGPVTVVNGTDATVSAISAISLSLPTSRRDRTAGVWRLANWASGCPDTCSSIPTTAKSPIPAYANPGPVARSVRTGATHPYSQASLEAWRVPPTSHPRLAPARDGAKEQASQDANSTRRRRTMALRSGYAGESAAPHLGRYRAVGSTALPDY